MFFVSSEESSNKKTRLDDDDATMSTDDLTRPLVTHVTTATPVQDFIALLKGEAPNFNLSKQLLVTALLVEVYCCCLIILWQSCLSPGGYIIWGRDGWDIRVSGE